MEKLINEMRQGKVFLVGEFRGAKTEVIRYVDKKTGQANSFTATNYLVERAGSLEVAMISQQVGDGAVDPSTVKVAAQKGKVYAFELTGMEKVRGVFKARMPAGVEPFAV